MEVLAWLLVARVLKISVSGINSSIDKRSSRSLKKGEITDELSFFLVKLLTLFLLLFFYSIFVSVFLFFISHHFFQPYSPSFCLSVFLYFFLSHCSFFLHNFVLSLSWQIYYTGPLIAHVESSIRKLLYMGPRGPPCEAEPRGLLVFCLFVILEKEIVR